MLLFAGQNCGYSLCWNNGCQTMVLNKKKILILVDWFYPGFRGGGLTKSTFNLVAGLCKEYEIRVITSDTDYGMQEPYSGIEKDRWTTTSHGMMVYYNSRTT